MKYFLIQGVKLQKLNIIPCFLSYKDYAEVSQNLSNERGKKGTGIYFKNCIIYRIYLADYL